MADKNDMRFMMKTVYWIAIGSAVAVVLYIAWQVFTIVYSGTH